MQKIILLSIYLFTISCKENVKPESISNNHYGYQVKLKERIICYGDIAAYQELYDIYSDDWNLGDMLSYSVIMANKYDYPEAYYDVFVILSSIPQINGNKCVQPECSEQGFYCLDQKTKNIAIEYLRKAIKKGSINALEKYNSLDIQDNIK